MEVEVLDSDVLGVEFRQIGYILRCSLSHAITLVSSQYPSSVAVVFFLLLFLF